MNYYKAELVELNSQGLEKELEFNKTILSQIVADIKKAQPREYGSLEYAILLDRKIDCEMNIKDINEVIQERGL